MKQIVTYTRVSSEEQAGEDKVSIDEQLDAITQLVKRNDWTVAAQFADSERYIKTRTPKKGKRVQPSGEYDDRPGFLAMLERVRQGDIDAVICWRDDRLVRHPRVNVALEEALDEADHQRKGKPKVEIFDATGALLDRFTMSIKAAVWKEENKRRVERIRMGKDGTLKAGGWPGVYDRLGYDTIREPGKRGKTITLGSDEEVQTVKDIFNWYDEGKSIRQIRRVLNTESRAQRGRVRKYDWSEIIIQAILRSPDYLGKAIWTFADGQIYEIEIPRLIEPDQWNRVQKRLDSRFKFFQRNTQGVYLLQHLLVCGECGAKLTISHIKYYYKKLADGTRKQYEYKKFKFAYRCPTANSHNALKSHPSPNNFQGVPLDWYVWRQVADNIIEHPDLIFEQVRNRQAELQAQGDSLEGDISKTRQRLKAIEQEKLAYSRQQARGKITEEQFDSLVAECEENEREEREDLERLLKLRDDSQSVRASVTYTEGLLANLQSRLPEIDIPPEELDLLPEEKQQDILRERQQAIRALCDKITLYANGDVDFNGLVDPGSVSQFGQAVYWSDLSKLLYQYSFSLSDLQMS